MIYSNASHVKSNEIIPIQWEIVCANLNILQKLIKHAFKLVEVTEERQKIFEELFSVLKTFQTSIRSKLDGFGTTYGRALNGVNFEIPNQNAVCRFMGGMKAHQTIDKIFAARKVSNWDVCLWMLSNYNSSKYHFYEIVKDAGLALHHTLQRILQEIVEPADLEKLLFVLLPFIPVIPKESYISMCKLLLLNDSSRQHYDQVS